MVNPNDGQVFAVKELRNLTTETGTLDKHEYELVRASLDGVDLASAVLKRTHLDLAGTVLLAELSGADVDTSA